MCMSDINSTKIQDKIKATIPEDGLKVYKVVRVEKNAYCPIYRYSSGPYGSGIKNANTNQSIFIHSMRERYQAGFHFWLTKKAARYGMEHVGGFRQHAEEEFRVVKCIVKKEWITTIGNDLPKWGKLARTIVAKRAIFPEYE